MSQPARSSAEPRLLDRVRELIRIKHYSIRTEEAYLQWIRRYIRFHGRRHPRELVRMSSEASFRISLFGAMSLRPLRTRL